jgi:heptaprenylglyceryl phosphate synthase
VIIAKCVQRLIYALTGHLPIHQFSMAGNKTQRDKFHDAVAYASLYISESDCYISGARVQAASLFGALALQPATWRVSSCSG